MNKNGEGMTKDHWTITQEGFHFISDMTASAMHEIKNKLAIINENSGLIQDLFFMAKQGREIDIERIESISHKIQKQVKLSDAIIKKINLFSQSMDMNDQDVDIEQAMISVVSLADRLIEKRGCSIHIAESPEPVIIHTNLFFFKNLLWRILDVVCRPDGSGLPLHISFQLKPENPLIHFNTGPQTDQHYDVLTRSDEITALLDLIGFKIKAFYDTGQICLLRSN